MLLPSLRPQGREKIVLEIRRLSFLPKRGLFGKGFQELGRGRNANSHGSRGHPEPSTRDLGPAGSLSSASHSKDSLGGFLRYSRETDQRFPEGLSGAPQPGPAPNIAGGHSWGAAPSLHNPLPIPLQVQDPWPRCATEKTRSFLGCFVERGKQRTRPRGHRCARWRRLPPADQRGPASPARWDQGQAAARREAPFE